MGGAGPPPAARVVERRAARLIAGANVYHLPSERPAVIGRDVTCDVVLGNSSISRRHAELAPSSGGYVVRDLGSANGTWVGLTRLQPHVPHGLEPGDSVRFGQVFFTFAVAEGDHEPDLGQRPHAVLIGPDGPVALQPMVTSIGRDLASDIVIASTDPVASITAREV